MSSKLHPLLPAMLALATLLSGCAAVDPKGVAPSLSPAADSVVDPQASLILAAAAKVYAGTYREVVKTRSHTPENEIAILTTSDVDPANRKLTQQTQNRRIGPAGTEWPVTEDPFTAAAMSDVIEFRYLGDIYYGPSDGSDWTHIVTSRLRPASSIRMAYESGSLFQPSHVRGLVSAVANSDGTYSGQIDLNRALAETPLELDRTVLRMQMEAEGSRRAVTATIDSQGFLVGLRYTTKVKVVDELSSMDVVVTFSRFGEPWTPMVPTAADEAPDVVYERW